MAPTLSSISRAGSFWSRNFWPATRAASALLRASVSSTKRLGNAKGMDLYRALRWDSPKSNSLGTVPSRLEARRVKSTLWAATLRGLMLTVAV